VIELPRTVLRRFLTASRRLVAGPRCRPPAVLIRAGRNVLSLEAAGAEAALRLDLGGRHAEAALALPAEALHDLAGPGGTVALNPDGPGRVLASWEDCEGPHERELTALDPDALVPFPALPARLAPAGSGLLDALAEASAVAAKEPTRFAVSRVLLRGRTGEVVATDGKQLLVRGGFDFPWPDDLLLPRLAVWDSRELPRDGPASVGRTDACAFVRSGPWTVAAVIDRAGRYPPFEGVVPRLSKSASRLDLDRDDAARLLRELPRVPGGGRDAEPVELTLGPQPSARAGGHEIPLSGSRAEGPPLRAACDVRHLRRALRLGLTALEFDGSERPACARGPDCTYVFVTLEPGTSPAPESAPPEESDVPDATNHKPAGPDPPAPDPVAEAEAVRGLLLEAGGRLGRLAAALKHHKRQAKALSAAVASLKQLPEIAPWPPAR
jgi:hypothetical protein